MSGSITRNWRLPALVDPTQPGPADLYTPLLARWGAAPGAPDPGAPGAAPGAAQSPQLGALLAQFAPGTAHIGDVLARLGGVPTQLEAMQQQVAADPGAYGGDTGTWGRPMRGLLSGADSERGEAGGGMSGVESSASEVSSDPNAGDAEAAAGAGGGNAEDEGNK